MSTQFFVIIPQSTLKIVLSKSFLNVKVFCQFIQSCVRIEDTHDIKEFWERNLILRKTKLIGNLFESAEPGKKIIKFYSLLQLINRHFQRVIVVLEVVEKIK